MADSVADHVEEISDINREIPLRNTEKSSSFEDTTPDDDVSHAMHTEPWRFENWIPGGYSQSRMVKCQKPSTTCNIINLFAGKRIILV
jgi:hypothetical protein